MAQRRDRDKKGAASTDLTTATLITPPVDIIPAARQLWENIRTQCQARGVNADQWIAETATVEIQKLASPGARDDFDALCRKGCHPHILALLVKGLRNCPELHTDLLPLTDTPRKLETRARQLEKAAVAIETTLAGMSEDFSGIALGISTVLGRSAPAQLAAELRYTAQMMRVAKLLSSATKARDAGQALLYLLCGYVLQATGGPYDLEVSGLVAQIRQDDGYNENALKQWRYRNVPVLDQGMLSEFRLVELLAALGKVIPATT